MSDNLKAFNTYLRSIENELSQGNATEHTHRSALKAVLESLGDGIVATNEPRRLECGAPDFVVTRGLTTIGYVEAKDVGKSLDEAEHSEQLHRYRDSLTNLVLTDYLEFRWYVDGELRLSVRLGTPTRDGRIKRDKAGIQAATWLFDDFLSHQAEPVGTPKELAAPREYRKLPAHAHWVKVSRKSFGPSQEIRSCSCGEESWETGSSKG
jgi:hypothetical protein